MNKLVDLLERKSQNILSVYFTAGYPKPGDTTNILEGLQEAGADIAEIGFPFSDPMADGPVIQRSSHISLFNGMNLDLLFTQLESIKERLKIPVVLMGYMNPAYKYGMEKFCRRCSSAGVSGLIIPDLPLDIYLEQYASVYQKYDLCYIPLVTPQTSDERIKKVSSAARGFIYLVSSSMTTGGKTDFRNQTGYFKRVRNLVHDKRLLVGFGISDAATFAFACKNANGGIIGSAFIKALEENAGATDTESIKRFVDSKRSFMEIV